MQGPGGCVSSLTVTGVTQNNTELKSQARDKFHGDEWKKSTFKEGGKPQTALHLSQVSTSRESPRHLPRSVVVGEQGFTRVCIGCGFALCKGNVSCTSYSRTFGYGKLRTTSRTT